MAYMSKNNIDGLMSKMISCVINYPSLANDVVEERARHLPDSKVLIELIRSAQIEPDITKEALIKPYENKNMIFSRLQKLSVMEPFLSENEAKVEFMSVLTAAENQQQRKSTKASILSAKTKAEEKKIVDDISRRKDSWKELLAQEEDPIDKETRRQEIVALKKEKAVILRQEMAEILAQNVRQNERNVPPFGGRVTDIDNKTFMCVVTTAKNSFRGGLSTIFHSVGHGQSVQLAKLMYKETLSKTDRQKLHTYVCEIMDSEGRNGETFKSAFSTVIDKLKTQDLLLYSEPYIGFDSLLELMTKPSHQKLYK